MAKPKTAAKPATRKAAPKKDAGGRFVKAGAKSAAKPGDKRAPRREMSPADIVNRDHQTRENAERDGHAAARTAARQSRAPR